MTTHRMEITLRILTIVFAIAGAAFWILPPALPDARVVERAAAATVADNHAKATLAESASTATIVESNIFSASRAAPGKRYTPPGSGGVAEEASAAASSDAPVMLATSPPRVFGTMVGPGGATALMQADSAGASGRLYREGERIGAYRIVKISASSVIVRGPEGRVELKIQPQEDRTQ